MLFLHVLNHVSLLLSVPKPNSRHRSKFGAGIFRKWVKEDIVDGSANIIEEQKGKCDCNAAREHDG